MNAAARKQIAKTLEEQVEPDNKPRLVIVGSSTLDGRGATLLRMRPSLLEELNQYAVGPLYLLIDLAVQDLVAKLKATPAKAGARYVKAETLDPSVYDRSLLAKANRTPKPRAKSKKAADESAAGASVD